MSAVKHGKAERRTQKAETSEKTTGKMGMFGLDKRTNRRIVGARVADYERLTHKGTGPSSAARLRRTGKCRLGICEPAVA